MADARNRIEKELYELRLKVMQARLRGPEPEPFVPECAGCGLQGFHQARRDGSPIRMYEMPAAWMEKSKFYCQDCLEMCTGEKPYEWVNGKPRDL